MVKKKKKKKKNPPAMQETQVQSLDWEDPLEKKMACWENPMDRGAWRAAELDMTTPPPPLSTQMLWSLRGLGGKRDSAVGLSLPAWG